MRNVWGLAIAGLLVLGCTRENKNGSLKVTIPVQKNVGALTGYNLEIAVANVQISGRAPIVARIETHDGNNAIPYGNQLTFNIPNLPSNTPALVQVMSLYAGTAQGDLKFYYGDKSVTLNGLTEVTINASPAGVSSGLEAKLAGRFLTSTNGGPTGRLVTLYEVGNGKPPMTVDEGWIVNGWFEAFAVQGAKFDLLAVPENIKLFDDLTVDGSGNVGRLIGGVMTPLSGSASRLEMQAPPTFRKRGTSVEPQPQMRLWLGFFDSVSDTFVNSVTREVRYPNPGDQGVMDLYLDANLTTPLRYRATGGNANDLRLVGSGGVSAAMEGLYSLTGAGCTDSEFGAGECLIFHHARVGSGREGYSGMQIPFRTMDPFSRHEGFTSARFLPAGCAGNPCIKMKWDLLPEAGVPLADVEVWYKYSTSNDSGGDSDRMTCDALPAMGFAKHGAVTTPVSTESYDFLASGMNQNNYYNYRFYLCPRMSTAAGPKYVGQPMRVESHGSNGMDHLGWAIAGTATVSASLIHEDYNQIGDLPEAPSKFYTLVALTAPAAAGIAVGDEVMVHISAKGGTSTCGTYNGQALQAGSYAFARVIGNPISSELRLSRGTFLDDMYASGITSTELASAATNANFCFVQVSKVRHYNNLVINSSSYLGVNSLSLVGTAGGGILPVRVNGTLTLSGNSAIKATGAGFAGGTTGYHGAGDDRDSNNTFKPYSGGGLGVGSPGKGGGGGGYGRGGRNNGGGDGAAGEGSYGGMGHIRMVMGGGGGGPGLAGTSSSGGGLVFLMADKIVSSGAPNLVSASAPAATSDGGAGGGGSVYVFARQVSGTAALNFEALGGDAVSGGKGGGGSVAALVCVNDPVTPVSITSLATKGSTGADTGGSPAQDGLVQVMNPNESYQCQSN